MKNIYRGAIDLVEEQKNTFSFIINEKKYQDYFEWIKQFVKIKVERKVAFRIEAQKVILLKDLLKKNDFSYAMCMSLFLDIGEQIEKLQEMGMGYLTINPEDVVFIQSDRNNFSMIFLNLENYFDVKNNVLEISKPYKKTYYFSPQIKNITQIPTKINYTQNIFYSLSMVVCNCLKSIEGDYTFEDYKKHLDCILETKLYWALLRCLKDKPEDRFYLFI